MMRTKMPRSMSIPLALLVGMFIHSLLFIGMDLAHLGMGRNTMVATAIGGFILSHAWWGRTVAFYRDLVARPAFTLKMYDMITLWAGGTIGYYVVWAAWYWPVTPFDAMAGIDLVARQVMAEGTIVNRVYTDPSLHGFLSNQPFYAPFAMLMQVIYRALGFGYGQVWLGVSAVMFSWFMWSSLRQVIHPFIAGILWLLLILTPELLGYTYLLQTDYINAVFLATAVILLYFTVEREGFDARGASILMLSAACWSRTETIALVGLGLLATLPLLLKKWDATKAWTFSILALVGGLITFGLWNGLYLQVMLPARPEAVTELAGLDPARFGSVVSDTFSNVILDKGLWAASFLVFILALLSNLAFKRTAAPYLILFWIVAVFIGLEIVGTVFTAAVVEQTLRRGIFKIIPLMFMYVAASPAMAIVDRKLTEWEGKR